MATARMKKIFSFVIVIFTLLFGCCSATVYKVGDSDGWTAKDHLYYHWTEDKEIHVGDSLIFEYDHNLNDVTQVSGGLEYEFCDSSFPKAVYNTGHDVVTFTEPGSYYFITSNHTQCTSGQRLGVFVVHDPSSPSPLPLPSKIIPSRHVYKVGDSKSWGVYDSDFYYNWSKEKQFNVGDGLLFEYNNEVNGVYEISGDLEFLNCDPTSPIAVHKTGHDIIKLTKPGIHYFISSEPGHCGAGLKLQVVVGTTLNVPKLSPLERLTRNRLHICDRFISWGIQVPSLCLLCNALDETRQHVFFDCPFSHEVWSFFCSNARVTPPRMFKDSARWLRHPCRDKKVAFILKLAYQASVYHIWRERNIRLNSNKSFP
ncbi:copper ion binding / electron carrier protein [Arabidopsis thaliana]|uniref:Copper ion binding / electron carrier protein n=1 Tax=Arabidopsis thaliana TaxID=3702 RepID=F4HPM4_ARATH|nr:copper ion binding / electron carrier protein [Arabidopsis thaliana]AEE32078.1 copper ion binding / electron carrier protein [Arabidopsis thaliana]|eukprot:NP_001031150.4 copper ion binding / electron carrier protein [Arabidopsis thaliana]